MSNQYIDRNAAAKTYRPTSGTMSEGLKRARAPYLFRNAVVGLGLGAFAVGVWAYSISAVKQDVFDDVDEEARALGAGSNNTTPTTVTTTTANANANATPAAATIATPTTPSLPAAAGFAQGTANIVLPGGALPLPPVLLSPKPADARGVLQSVGKRWPRVLDPERKTLVWGAPPVDNIGRMGSSLLYRS